MLTYLYVRCALGQGSRGSLAKFSSFNDLELIKGLDRGSAIRAFGIFKGRAWLPRLTR